MKQPDYLTQLAEFAAGASLQSLTPEALQRARLILADCVPVVAAGMQEPEMKRFVAQQLTSNASDEAWVIGTGVRASALDAALLNGTAGTWLELDEGNLYAKGHPGIQVVPAAIACAQATGASGADLVLAVALGYEISARVSRAANMHLTIHPHGTYGVIGAAIAAAKLQRFDTARMRELLNVSATMGMATSRRTLLDGATVRNIFTGHSGYMGLTAARLVGCGFTGGVDALGDIYGTVLSDTFDRERVVEGLGTEWLVTQNYFKLHSTGRYVHSAIDALQDALNRVPGGQLDADDIERIEVRTYMLAAMLAERRVTSSFGARFSVPFALASIIHHRHTGLACYTDDAVANPTVQALAGRVDLAEDPAHTAAYPRQTRCDLRIVMRDGSVHEGRCVLMKGEPDNPHRPAELRDKFFALGTPVWGEQRTRQLHEDLMAVETIPDFRAYAERFAL